MDVTGGPRIRAVDTVDDIPAPAWDALAGTDELYLSTPWMRVLEATSGALMRYLLAYRGTELVGGLPTARADDQAPWLSGRPDTLLQRCVREGRPAAAEVAAALGDEATPALLPGTVCGGRHLGRNRVVAASPDLVERLVHAAEQLGRDRGDRSVSFLYVDDEDKVLRDVLTARGYHHYHAARYSWLDVPRDGFPGYLGSVSAHRRRRIARERRKLREAGVGVELEPLQGGVVPRMAELETNLLRRHGTRWSAHLSEQIFSAISAALGQAAFVSAARRDGQLTGFTLLVERGSTWYAHRAGFDYEANGDLPVYFDVTYYRPLEVAASRGVAAIHYGTGSDDTKASRGCASTIQHAYTLPLAPAAAPAPALRGGRRLAIRPLDVYDAEALDGLYRLEHAVALADLPDLAPPCPLDVTGAARFPWPGTVHEDLLAWDGDCVVGALRAVRSDLHPDEVRLEHLLVHPSRRRGGIGTALLRAAWDVWPHVTAVTGSLVRQVEGGPTRDAAAEGFARSQGATLLARTLRARLDVGAVQDDAARRVQQALASLPGYSLRHWGSAAPEPLRDGLARLLAVAGAGTDPARCLAHLRGMERMRAGRQRHTWDSGVWHDASGALVAWSSITMTHSVRDRATQGMTVVTPSHRGRGLGLLVKAGNLLHAMRHEPHLVSIDAANAATNTPVIELNTKLGYRQVDESMTWRLERAGS